MQGVEFTYLRVADIAMNNEMVDGQRQVGVLYGFDGADAVLSAIGVTAADAHKSENGKNYYTSDLLNNKLSAALVRQCHHREKCAGNGCEERRGYDGNRCRWSHLRGKS